MLSLEDWDPDPQDAPSADLQPSLPGRRVSGGRLPAGRVLLIEDDPDDAALIEAHLRRAGAYEVEHVTRVRDALACLGRGASFDVVLADLQLPDGRGPAVVTRLVGESPHVPVVVLTTLVGSAVAERCLEAGAQDYLAKDELGARSLRRVIGFAVARQREGRLRRAFLHDDRLRSLGALAAGVAHEVNNPAAFILANLEHLERSLESGSVAPTDPDLLASIRESREGVARIQRLVANLQIFAREGKDRVVDVPLAEVVNEATTLAGPRLRQHGGQLVIEGDALPRLPAYEGQISQVLVNLVVNAAQALGPGGGLVRLRSRVDEAAVRIAVEDDGSGISASSLERVFEPFFSTKARGDGVGLGLALCADIAERHGGALEVESEVGVGSTFTLVLPRDNGLIPVPEPAEEPPALETRPRVLLVDDEKLVLRSVARLLRDEADVQGVTSGCEALALLEEGARFDAVVTDLMMPGMSGAELLDRLGDAHGDLAERAIVMTGGVDEGAKVSFIGAGRRQLVPKPATRAELLEALRAVMPVGA